MGLRLLDSLDFELSVGTTLLVRSGDMCSLHAFPALASLAAGCLGLNGPDTWVDDVVQLDRLPRPAVVLGGGQARLSGRLELGVDRGVSLAPHHSVHPALHHSATLLCLVRLPPRRF